MQSNIKTAAFGENNSHLRLLVAIASFGKKNLEFLERIIGTYQKLPMNVDVVVFSDRPKKIGQGVEVIVGLPSRNSWSLPFAHKAYFAQNADRYDVYIYTEDDIEVTEKNIQAFLRLTPELRPDEIAGYLRYELGPSGAMSLPDVHKAFHWKPESVKQRGVHTIAEFTNEHAGFYILTQAQLKQAIASGGFLIKPCDGRYGMLETAATDPYTSCGFRKVICISALEDFLIHHLPNRYAGQLGLSFSSFKEQVQTLVDISKNAHPVDSLCGTESKLLHGRWSKNYYEKPCNEVLEMVPRDSQTILSIGCGWGATESCLKQRGVKITVLPLDSVMGATGSRLGFEVIYGTMEECFSRLGERNFDCVLITNLLHLQPNPWQILDQCCRFAGQRGTIVISGPNFRSLQILTKRALNMSEYRKLSDFAQGGIQPLSAKAIARRLACAGWNVVAMRLFNHTSPQNMVYLRRWLGYFVAESWVFSARQSHLLGQNGSDNDSMGVVSNRQAQSQPAEILPPHI